MKPAEPACAQTLYSEIVGRDPADRPLRAVLSRTATVTTPASRRGRTTRSTAGRKAASKGAERGPAGRQPTWPQGHSYYSVGRLAVSPDNATLAYGVDTVSAAEVHASASQDLATGENTAEEINMTAGAAAWAADSKTVFYTHDRRRRPCAPQKVFRHVLGDARPSRRPRLPRGQRRDLRRGRRPQPTSRRYLILACSSTLSERIPFILDAAKPDGEFTVFQERVRGLEYSIDHLRDQLLRPDQRRGQATSGS
ncbi:MAG: hypothetical protein M0C28_00400 [Candidatus Moduliflexus flocculans]|nr:hypothetical protein [Candidatus Moduliflexus flocculans]